MMIAMTAATDETATDDARWLAVQRRDAAHDGAFVTAVRTTGIYCRPSCPARTPKRENVRFYASPDSAERAGFRACRRCHPRDPARSEVALAERVCELLRAGGSQMPTLEDLGRAVGVSPFHLQRTFKRVMGVSPRQYAAAQRTQRLKTGLRRTATVTSALYQAGFGSSSRLYEHAPDLLGMTPAAYRNHGRGMRIAYTIVDSPFGRLLAAGTERGIASVAVHEDEAVLVDAMRGEYAAAEIVRDDAAAAPWAAIVLATLRDGAIPADLPLDVRVTAFQARVYAALRQIPAGETRSYSEVASAIGAPKAVRAVARACATNPTPIVVPCHRVVHKDGNVSGFRWGTERKRAILAAERAAARQQTADNRQQTGRSADDADGRR